MVNRGMVNRSAPDLFPVMNLVNCGFIPAEQKSAAPPTWQEIMPVYHCKQIAFSWL
jgi:hypothetical protein